MAMHKIPDYPIYIGSLLALQGQRSIKEAGITHILSILRDDVEPRLVADFEHKQIQLDDDEEEDILGVFNECFEFIDEGIAKGGNVLVHCIAGISRSGTICTAYIMRNEKISAPEAIEKIRQSRKIVSPNDSFREQLDIFEKDGFVVDDTKEGYRRWKLKKNAELATAAGSAPVLKDYSSTSEVDGKATELRCKKCRCPLATTNTVIRHEPPTNLPPPNTRAYYEAIKAGPYKTTVGPGMISIIGQSCMHYFLEPIRWMQPELERGELEGKFECPKCKTKVGSYRWQGMKCTCGAWVTPGISLQRGRVDEVRPFALPRA
ncbi:protein-tyrosine phosphatase-like protein [Myxozyma melibiosi]|uniref:protein-tyrosine-phosphatase n=1 Tax=Myxozyma melibiosi TaxID=54550 RepID=A0ABR1F6I8_9ASCO